MVFLAASAGALFQHAADFSRNDDMETKGCQVQNKVVGVRIRSEKALSEV